MKRRDYQAYLQAYLQSPPSSLEGEGWGRECLFDSAGPAPPSRFPRFAREATSPTRAEVSRASG
jgi:hypothetical protein